MRSNSTQIGAYYETLACNYLKRQGFTLIERNFHIHGGEIDLIMQDRETIVFVEVKYRKKSNYGLATEMLTKTKMKRLMKSALFWLQKNNISSEMAAIRFDFVAISGKSESIDWIKNIMIQG